MSNLALYLNIIGALIGCLSAMLFAFRIWQKKEHANLATWAIVWLLDFAGLYLAYATGNNEPYVQIGWCFAASLILLATWLRKGLWVWSRTDSYVLILCTVSLAIWLLSGSVAWSLAGYIAAALLSALPQAKDYLEYPARARASAWVWLVSIAAMLFTLGSKIISGELGIEHTLVYSALLFLNIVMSFLCLRMKK